MSIFFLASRLLDCQLQIKFLDVSLLDLWCDDDFLNIFLYIHYEDSNILWKYQSFFIGLTFSLNGPIV